MRTGKWVDRYTAEGVDYKNVQFYKKGIERGVWKSYANGKMIIREKYRGDSSYIQHFYPNGKISSSGKSVIIRNDKDNLHWLYTGEWKYFTQSGQLEYRRIYKNGLDYVQIPALK